MKAAKYNKNKTNKQLTGVSAMAKTGKVNQIINDKKVKKQKAKGSKKK